MYFPFNIKLNYIILAREEQWTIRKAFQVWEDNTFLTFKELDRAHASQYTGTNYVLLTRDPDLGYRQHLNNTNK